MASRYGPCTGLPRCAQSVQNLRVSRNACSASTGFGGDSWLGFQVSTNGTRSPARTVKSETVLISLPLVGAGVRSRTRSGPAIASTMSSWWRTQGTTSP